jgi:hypothetical protein
MPEGLVRLFFGEGLEKHDIDAEFKTISEPGSPELQQQWRKRSERRGSRPTPTR